MQSSRSSSNMRKIIQDLELRLGPSCAPKAAAAAAAGGSILAATNCSRGGFPNLIMIQDDDHDQDDDYDDDDDVLMYDPTPSSSSVAMQLFPITSSWVPVITEEDLELRLGSRANFPHFSTHNGASGHNVEVKEEPSQTWKCVKAKYGFASSSRHCVKEVESVKLRCTICMDTMKEETSTMCGHVFCKSCIVNAIRVQNRCPTCRKEISINNIHRIYLPGATTS